MFIFNDVPAAEKHIMDIKNNKLKRFLVLISKYTEAVITTIAIDCWNVRIISSIENGKKTNMSKKIRMMGYILNSMSIFLFLNKLTLMANKRAIIKGSIENLYKFDKMRCSDWISV